MIQEYSRYSRPHSERTIPQVGATAHQRTFIDEFSSRSLLLKLQVDQVFLLLPSPCFCFSPRCPRWSSKVSQMEFLRRVATYWRSRSRGSPENPPQPGLNTDSHIYHQLSPSLSCIFPCFWRCFVSLRFLMLLYFAPVLHGFYHRNHSIPHVCS